MASVVDSLTGIEDRITWPHQDDHPVGEAISSVTDMEGGPDAWVTPAWPAAGRRPEGAGTAPDLALTPERIIACTMTIDPGGQVDELRGVTDIGSASYRHVHRGERAGARQPTAGSAKLVPVPNGLKYDAGPTVDPKARPSGRRGHRSPLR
jgi:hypothetical protein